MSHLEINEVILIHWNNVSNYYEWDPRILHKFVPSKWFGKLLDISAKNIIFLKTVNKEFSYIEV